MLGANDADGATVAALPLLASCQMVLHLSQDLKHLLSRYTNTLTCTVHRLGPGLGVSVYWFSNCVYCSGML